MYVGHTSINETVRKRMLFFWENFIWKLLNSGPIALSIIANLLESYLQQNEY